MRRALALAALLGGFFVAAPAHAAPAWAFTLTCGQDLEISGGEYRDLTGLVKVDVAPDCTASTVVHIHNTHLTDVRAIVWGDKGDGPIRVGMWGVTATGLGDGVRAVVDRLYVHGSTLTGGGRPPSGDPAGLHMLDDAAGTVADPDSTAYVGYSTVTGFTSDGFQGDAILLETRVSYARIEHNTLGRDTDSGAVDSKAGHVDLTRNVIYSDGDRAIAGHFGLLESSFNTIIQAPVAGSEVYDATGGLNASHDTVTLGAGARLAKGDVVLKPGSGPPSTYPRVGNILLRYITDPAGQVLVGPNVISTAGGYTPTITVDTEPPK